MAISISRDIFWRGLDFFPLCCVDDVRLNVVFFFFNFLVSKISGVGTDPTPVAVAQAYDCIRNGYGFGSRSGELFIYYFKFLF